MNRPAPTLRLPTVATVRAVSELLQQHLLGLLSAEGLAQRLETVAWPASPPETPTHPDLRSQVVAVWQMELRRELRPILVALRRRETEFVDLDRESPEDLERATEVAPIRYRVLRLWWDVRDAAAREVLEGAVARATQTMRGQP